MASAPVRPWGNDRADIANTGPQFEYLGDNSLTGGAAANVQPTASGWALELPWAAETLVAMGGLGMAAPVILRLAQYGSVSNTNSEVLGVTVQLDRGVTIPANTANVHIVAIGDNANTANVNVVYSATLSNPKAGTLVFVSAAQDFTTYTNAATFTVNSSSTFSGSGNLYAQRAKTKLAITATFPAPLVIAIQ